MGKGINIDVNLRTVFDSSAGAQATQGYRQMINQLVNMAQQAGHQLSANLFTKSGKFDTRKYTQAAQELSKLGFNIEATFDETGKNLRGFFASISDAGGISKLSQSFDIIDGKVQASTQKRAIAVENIEQQYNHLYADLNRSTKQQFELEKQGIEATSEEYTQLGKHIKEVREQIEDLNNKSAKSLSTTTKDGKLQGKSAIAQNQRRLEYGYQANLRDLDRSKLQSAEAALAQTTKQWYSERVKLKDMLITNANKTTAYSAEELGRQRDYIANLGEQKAQQEKIYKNLGGVVEESAKLNKVTHDGERAVSKRNQMLTHTTSLMDKLRLQFGGILKGVVQAGISWKLFAGITRTVKESIEIVKNLDSAMVDLQMATGKSKDEMRGLLVEYNQMAKQLGTTTAEVAKSADTWLRMGYSAQDTNTLIKNSLVLSKVGQLESAEATQYLVSAMKGFNIEAKDSISIVDKLSAVDLESATSAGGIAEALSRTAESAQLAGVSLDKVIGYIATVAEVTQRDEATVGESFKTLFARLQKIAAGVDIDDEGESLNEVDTVLRRLGISLTDTSGNFRKMGDVLDEISSKWKSFSNIEQAQIATAIAGKQSRVLEHIVIYDALQYKYVA